MCISFLGSLSLYGDFIRHFSGMQLKKDPPQEGLATGQIIIDAMWRAWQISIARIRVERIIVDFRG